VHKQEKTIFLRMRNPITLSAVAKTLGVHHSTVSRALSRHPGIPEETRLRVVAKAEALGYRPDPMLRSLQAYVTRKKKRGEGVKTTIALVVLHEQMEQWAGHSFGQSYLAGVQRRTRELGFAVDAFCLPQLQREGRDLDAILRARGIRAVLLASPPRVMTCEGLDWSRYAVAALGYSVVEPVVHRAVHHYRFAVREAIEQLRRRGYRRFGLAYAPEDERRLQDGWTGGFRIEQGRKNKGERFLYYRQHYVPSRVNYWNELEAFQAWVKKERPEVILAAADWVPGFLFKHMKLKDAAQVGFVHLARAQGETKFAGIDQRLDEVGVAAVDLLAGMVHQNDYGLPSVPKVVVIEGKWVDGETVREMRS
jgi:LacI family transcriptional regulator